MQSFLKDPDEGFLLQVPALHFCSWVLVDILASRLSFTSFLNPGAGSVCIVAVRPSVQCDGRMR